MIADIASVIAALSALLAVLVSWRNAKKIQEVHVLINSRMSELLVSATRAARANGVVQGTTDEAKRRRER